MSTNADNPKRRGRPSILSSKANRENIIKAISLGFSVRDAAEAVGIAESTLHKIIAGNERPHDVDEKTFTDFMDRLTRARTKGEIELADLIKRHAREDWRAAAWILERRRSDLFGKVDKIEHSGPNGGPIQSARLTPEDLDDETLRRLLDAKRAKQESVE